jgi:hypothetical protein
MLRHMVALLDAGLTLGRLGPVRPLAPSRTCLFLFFFVSTCSSTSLLSSFSLACALVSSLLSGSLFGRTFVLSLAKGCKPTFDNNDLKLHFKLGRAADQ